MSEQALLSSPLPGSGADSVPPPSLGSAECCEEHKEYVSLFCLDDLEPICKQCAADSHSRHRVYLSAEAAVDCKAELQTSLAGLDVKIKHLEDVIQTYQKAAKCNQAESKLTEEIMREEIERLHQFLRQEEAARLRALMEEKEEKTRKAEERMHRLNEVITSLEDKIQLTERELHAGGEGVAYLQNYKDTMSSTWCGNTKPERIQRPLINVAKHLGNLRYAVWEKMKQIAPCAPVTLGPRTAGQPARLSSELKSFHITPGCSRRPEQRMNEAFPANPERFQLHPCVLATGGFNTGVHHWDMEVGSTKRWTIGVAAPSALGKTKRQASPEAGTWCIGLKDGEYRALTSPPLTLDLDSSLHLSRVRVRLDCEGGTLEFTDADTDAPLFTFTHCFTETVYPYVESASVADGVTALEQRGSVSVDSDYVPLKDAVTILEGQATRGNAPTGKNTAAGKKRGEDAERLSENKTSKDTCSREEEKPAKSNGKEKTSNTREAKKQSRKSRFNASYHVSLYKALTDTATDCKSSNKSK